MLRATFCVIAALVGVLPLCAEETGRPSIRSAPVPLTVILDFKNGHSNLVIDLMKRSTEQMLIGSGLHLDWKLRSEVGSQAFPELVLVTLHGNCDIDPAKSTFPEPGPLASTRIVDNGVLPFADVYCDRISALLQTAMRPMDLPQRQLNMGRALAKVLTHELMHMMTRSAVHGVAGVAQPALSGRQLVDQETALEADDLDRIREEAR